MVALALGWLSLAPTAFGQAAGFDSLRASAEAARSQGDAAQAIQLYTQAVAVNPGWQEGWWSLGTMNYGADRFAPARDALSHLIELSPNATAALALRGLCEYETGQYQESLEDLQRGIALGAASQPRNAGIVLYHEASVLTRLGRFDEAIARYIAFVKDAPPSPELTVAVGLAGMHTPLLPREVQASQEEVLTMVGHASIAVMTGDLSGGQAAFQAIFDRNPAMPSVHYLYGYLLFATHSDQADAQFRQELSVSPDNAMAHAMLAWSLEFQGDYAGALADAQKAAAADPGLTFGQLVYARALVEAGDLNEGLSHLQNVLRSDPGNLEAHLTLAKAYSKLGRSDYASQERLLCLKMADQSAPGGAPASANP